MDGHPSSSSPSASVNPLLPSALPATATISGLTAEQFQALSAMQNSIAKLSQDHAALQAQVKQLSSVSDNEETENKGPEVNISSFSPSRSRHRQSSASSSRSSSPSSFVKAESKKPSSYNGSGPVHIWLTKMDNYFDAGGLNDANRVKVAATYLEDEVTTWWAKEQKSAPTASWAEMQRRLKARFQPLAQSEMGRTVLHWTPKIMSRGFELSPAFARFHMQLKLECVNIV